MSWYTLSQKRKKLFVVEFKPNRNPDAPIQTKALLLDSEEQSREYVRKIVPGSVVVSVKESNKFRVKYAPDFSSRDTYEDVIADTPEQAKEIILKKFPQATFNGEPLNLSIELMPAKQAPPPAEMRNQNRLERTVFKPWETNNPMRKDLPNS